MPLLFLLFLLVPLAEIWILIEVGSVIGAGWTIFFVVFTAVTGAWLVRRQGLSALNRVRSAIDANQVPAMEMLEGVFLLVAGALLLTPGFFTDAVGFACLTPPLRRAMIQGLVRRGVIRSAAGGQNGGPGPDRGHGGPGRVVDGYSRRVDD